MCPSFYKLHSNQLKAQKVTVFVCSNFTLQKYLLLGDMTSIQDINPLMQISYLRYYDNFTNTQRIFVAICYISTCNYS